MAVIALDVKDGRAKARLATPLGNINVGGKTYHDCADRGPRQVYVVATPARNSGATVGELPVSMIAPAKCTLGRVADKNKLLPDADLLSSPNQTPTLLCDYQHGPGPGLTFLADGTGL